MSDPASYAFIPWVRTGLSSSAQAVPGANYLGTQVAVTVNATAAQPVSVRLHGPGQVTGIDPRAIIRTEPLADTSTFEPNYFLASSSRRPMSPGRSRRPRPRGRC